MACFKPVTAWRARQAGPSGKRPLVFSEALSAPGSELQIPCGQCVGCRLEHSRQWAVRCMHEASLYDDNCFLTLTYDDEHLPATGSLDKTHFPDFIKRLRARGIKVRYFHCGEYGERLQRPHYHACIFGFDFPDRVLYSERDGIRLYTSELLSELWGFGFCTIGDLTFESAAYTARYVMKKVTGDAAEEHYMSFNPLTGEVFQLEPEYTTMSRRPGIGRDWYERYKAEVFPYDEVIVRGVPCKVPKAYSRYLEAECPEDFVALKEDRISSARKYAHNNTDWHVVKLDNGYVRNVPGRLQAREGVVEARVKLLKRGIEGDS